MEKKFKVGEIMKKIGEKELFVILGIKIEKNCFVYVLRSKESMKHYFYSEESLESKFEQVKVINK